MKKRKITALFLAVLLLATSLFACGQSEQEKKFDELTKKSSSSDLASVVAAAPESSTISSEPEPTPEPTPYVDPEGLEGEFTILAYQKTVGAGQQDKMDSLAKEFMKLHPGVKINIEYASRVLDGQTQQERREKYRARVLTELGSGEADYLIYSPIEELNIYGLSKSGLFIDLWPYFENDPTIDPNDYYSQVLDAVAVKGKLTTMPFSFSFDGMMLNRPLMEEMEVDLDSLTSFDYKQLLDWQEQAKAIDSNVQVTFGAITQKVLYNVEAAAYLDLENGTSDYQSPEFIEFLTRTGALEESDKEGLGDYASAAMDAQAIEWLMKQWESGEEPDREFTPDFMQVFFDNAHPGVAVASDISAEELGYLGHPLGHLPGRILSPAQKASWA